jgi:hypothetical protein
LRIKDDMKEEDFFVLDEHGQRIEVLTDLDGVRAPHHLTRRYYTSGRGTLLGAKGATYTGSRERSIL